MPLRPYPVPMPSCSPHLMQIGYSVQRGGEARFLVSCPPPRAAWIPGPAGVAGGKRRGRTKSGKGGRGFISPAGIFSSPHADRVLGSAGGRGALPRLLSPASRRVDSRAGRDGGAGSGRDGGSARCEKAGAARGAKKGTGGAGSPFPRWVASLPHIARIPGPARNVGARRPYPTSIRFPVQRGWWGGSGMQKGTSTGYGRRCALASARMTGRGILPHVDRAPGSAGVWGAARTRRREASARGVRARKNRCALASARGGGAGILPPRRSGSRFSAGRRGEERARCGPTRLNAIRPALFVRGDSLWIPAATYLPGPSPAKYCRRMRA